MNPPKPLVPAVARVRDVMSTPVAAVAASDTVAHALAVLERAGVHYLAVCSSGRVVGVVCACDLLLAFPNRPVLAICHPPKTVASGEDLDAAAALMEERNVGSLLVMDGGQLVGIITCGDLARAGLFDRDRWRCASCGAHHELIAQEDGIQFCAACLDQVDSSGYRRYYFTLGGGD